MTRLPRRPLLLAALALPAVARAQPRRPLRIVVPFPAGGAVDSLARVMADRLPALLDQQQVVVDNRSGGGGLIGADAVAKAAPDGTTIGIIGAATLCAAPFLQQTMPFDVARDLRAVTQITDSAVLLAVGAQLAESRGWTGMGALLDWARANPGAFRVAHSGVATVTHLVMSAVVAQARVDMTLVPYRGGAQQATDLIAGTIEGSADLPASLMPHAAAGRVRLLGTSSGTRLGLLPDVPAFAETPALSGFDVRSWNAIMVPAGTPEAEIARLHAAIAQLGATTSFRDALRPLGYDAVTSASPGAAAQLIRDETPRWQRLVQVSGARIE
ncbi:Bug family tripartite tricarboxylate transporter substrate binding protein [Falsiroseomonas oryziterrae]|uniref:Bug family tripartite tricarboxylate transporter substrate binding protein n=1 Tax=Falsiroseomonas oryziterrae TaxID=2911368 RepID=UPI001F48A869|nr:tripartite tricarboxylate transporter substrate binding protein [Roseomonas sp. NPKOSM-4]